MPAPIPVEQQFTDKQKAEIGKLYLSGLTQQQLADRYSVPRRTMMKLCVRLGLHRNHVEAQGTKFAEGFVESASELRSQGKTLHQIAADTGKSLSAVHRAVVKSGTQKPPSLINTIDPGFLVSEYESGMSFGQLADKYNTSSWTISKILHDSGATVRQPLFEAKPHLVVDKSASLPPFVDSAEWFRTAYVDHARSLTEIAKFVGKSTGYVNAKLSKYGISLRSISQSLSVLDRPSVLAAYTELGSMQKTAARFNCTAQAIKNILTNNDVTPRTPSEILSGEGNPFFGKQHPEETRKFCAEAGAIGGAKFWADHPEYIEVVREKSKEYWSDLSRRYENSKRIAALRKEGKCSARRGTTQSRFGVMDYDSSYELQFIEFCEADSRIVWLERDFDVIDYEYSGHRSYVPDFRLWLSNGEFLVVEIKSDWYSRQEKERSKIVAGFGRFADRFQVLSDKSMFGEVSDRISVSMNPLEFDFADVELREIGAAEYDSFYGCFHYLGKGGRRGFTVGGFLAGKLIAATTIGSITRAETAAKQGLSQSAMRELVRFCIHPDFHKKNLASWFLSRAVKSYKAANSAVVMLVAFADGSQGHVGTIYKSSNWVEDGRTVPSYHYLDGSGGVVHKKTVYDQAKKLGISEREHAQQRDLRKVKELPKIRFLLPL